jgi:hypothetical protein
MRRILAAAALSLLAACGGREEPPPPGEPPAPQVRTLDREGLDAIRAQFARVEMRPDVSFLTDDERRIVNLLNQVGDLMSEIYLRQISEDGPRLRAEIAASAHPDRELLLDLFDLHFGVWDSLNQNRPFYGETPLPPGAGFYPADMTKEEFERWIADHPEDEEAFKSPYTVIRRDGDRLVAIP